MTLADPFTSDNARVEVLTGRQAVRLIAVVTESMERDLRAVFGPAGRARWKQYFNCDGEWQAGFVSMYGFHIRGRGNDPARVTAEAIASRVDNSDPSPSRPDLLPAGAF